MTAPVAVLETPVLAVASQGPFGRAVRRLRRDRATMAAALWLTFIGAVAVLQNFWTPHGPNEQFVADPFLRVGGDVWLGTDDRRRTVYDRVATTYVVKV